MSNTVKLIIELPTDKYLSVKTNMINDIIYDAVKHGIPLDNNSERAEVQAYFAGKAYGWEEERKAIIDDVMSVFDDFMCGEVDEDGMDIFLEMLIDKAESER